MKLATGSLRASRAFNIVGFNIKDDRRRGATLSGSRSFYFFDGQSGVMSDVNNVKLFRVLKRRGRTFYRAQRQYQTDYSLHAYK